MDIHPAVAERLARLAPDQREAATWPAGPVLCVAPAGSGKTTTLVARICWLVATGTRPETITALTFNKRAADELAERLKAALTPLIGEDESRLPRVRTFHALGREILAGSGANVTNLVDRADVLRALNRGRALPAPLLRALDDGFSRIKLDLRLTAEEVSAGLGVPTAPVDARIARAFVEYEAWLLDHDALDFDDLVRRALALLRADAAALELWRARCASLLVDEVQDVDRSQLELAVLLSGEGRNVFLVGDDDQTIYAWRLADVRRVLDLAASLPGLRRVDLVTNYRCPRAVVERAVRLIERNGERFAKRIQAGPLADGVLFLLPDGGDELAPYAALALERGITYRAAEDGLLLDEPGLDELLTQLPDGERPAVSLARLGGRGRLARALLGWAVPYSSADDLRAAVTHARARRTELRRDDARLVLATAHGTKGLEFDHVACVGLDENVFPSRRTLQDSDNPTRALEEERRLAYVAWTRARRSLVLVYDPAAPSPFMRDAFSDDELGLATPRAERVAA